MRLKCTTCDGTGIGVGMRAGFGELMNLCSQCDGHGSLTSDTGPRDFVAIFAVSARYVVHLKIPRTKGGTVPIDVMWSPDLPPEKGRKRLTPGERRAYEQGRTASLQALQHQLGGGSFTVLKAGERH